MDQLAMLESSLAAAAAHHSGPLELPLSNIKYCLPASVRSNGSTSSSSRSPSVQSVQSLGGRRVKNGGVKKTKSSESVQRRNERERNRIRKVNEAFDKLRTFVPYTGNNTKRKVSKVDTLNLAILYIKALQGELKTTTSTSGSADAASSSDEDSSSVCSDESVFLHSASQLSELMGMQPPPPAALNNSVQMSDMSSPQSSYVMSLSDVTADAASNVVGDLQPVDPVAEYPPVAIAGSGGRAPESSDDWMNVNQINPTIGFLYESPASSSTSSQLSPVAQLPENW